MSKRLHRNEGIISDLSRFRKPEKRNKVLKEANNDQIIALIECVSNLMNGAVPLSKQQKYKLKPHQNILRTISKERRMKKAQQLLVQHGGLLPAILIPIISAIATGVLSETISKLINK